MPKRDVPQAGGHRACGRALKRGQIFGGADTLQNLQEGEGLALNERKLPKTREKLGKVSSRRILEFTQDRKQLEFQQPPGTLEKTS